jgi:sterol desaturase/sphingolipid hydroxylase (fatty acid hydroxylase superfamily)
METKNFFDVWAAIYLIDLLRYFIPASIAYLVFWVIGRNHWRHLFIQSSFPKNKQLRKEFAYSMSTVVIFSLVGFGLYLGINAGLTPVYNNISDFGVFYLVLSFVLALLFHDFYFYWTHRFMHHKKIFKYVHRVHHESTNPSPWAAYAFHPWEALIQALVFPVMVFTLPLHPIIMTLFLIYMILRNVIGHLGFEIFPKGWTKNKWLNWTTAVTHHNIHHERFTTNYGLYFSWWDRWMKTEDKSYHQKFDEVKLRPKISERKTKASTVTITTILIASLLSMSGYAQSVEGKWTTYNEETGSALAVIEIVKANNSIEGKVSEIFLEPFQGDDPICTKCSGERKDKKVINMNFLWGFKKEGNEWTGGSILDPQDGEVYSSKLWLEDNNTLKVRGYGGMMDLFYRTQTWKRLDTSQTNSPRGLWKTIDDTWNKVKSVVEIVERNGELFGYIRQIFLLPHEGKDPVCIACDGKLKNTKVVGMTILGKFKQKGAKWEDGEILDPGNGKVYAASIWLVSNDELRVRGFLGPFYRTQTWKRVRSETSNLQSSQ